MFKKLMFMLVFSSGFVRSESDPVATLAIVAGATAVAGTGIYLAVRESNDVKIERAQDWLIYYSGNLHYDLARISNLSDLQQFISQSTKFKKEMQVFCKGVRNSYFEIKARYGSWVTPWNWSSKMKLAYIQIKELHDVVKMIDMMFMYQPLMTVYQEDLDENVIVKKAQAICHAASLYPMIYCANMMKDDLSFLKNTHFKISCDIVLVDLLERALELVLTSDAFVQERRIQEEMAIKERQAKAQEAQVAAQLAQAKALSDQAKAQQDRNRIEREKLEHKKNQ
jgi:hypothetical protein